MNFLRGILVLCALAWGGQALAEEAIRHFDSKIMVTQDGTLAVTETIEVNVEGRAIRRGITRDFPTDYRLPNGRKVTTTFDVVQVLMNGGDVNWTTERISNGTRVRIGSADVFLRPGVYTYEIRYRTDRQLYFGEGFDELYWNVTGNDWAFPIYRATARVTVPEGAQINSDARAYTGYQGESGNSYNMDLGSNPRQVNFETTRRLNGAEGLTIVVTWPEGFVERPTEAELVGNFFLDNLGVIVGFITVIILAVFYYLMWRQVGKDPDTGPVVPYYDPPLGISPAAAAYIEDREYKMSQFTAAIVNMAVKGAIVIEEEGKRKFRLRKTGEKKGLSIGEERILSSLLSGTSSIVTKQSNHSTFQSAKTRHKETLRSSHENIHFIRNRKYFWIGAGISLLAALIVVGVEFSMGNEVILILPVLLAFYSVFFFVLTKGIKSRMGARGCAMIPTVIAIGFVIFHFIGMVGGLLYDNLLIAVPFLLIFGLNFLFLGLLEKPTIEGARLLAEIKGFKKYLSMAEKDRLEFHTGEITPEKFEAYLPYAIALGVENKWGKAFESEMVKAGLDPKQYQPTWYYGGNYSGFSGSSNFGSAFGGAFAGAVASASAPPASSGGSGGGGFSGGGGGGGGGGGW